MAFAATPAVAKIPQASRIMGPLPSHRFSRCSPGTTGRASRAPPQRVIPGRAQRSNPDGFILGRGARINLSASSPGEGPSTRHPRARLCRDPRIHDPRRKCRSPPRRPWRRSRKPRGSWVPFPRIASRCSPGTTGRASRAPPQRVIPGRAQRTNLASSPGEGPSTRHPRARLCRDPRIHDPRPTSLRRHAGHRAFPARPAGGAVIAAAGWPASARCGPAPSPAAVPA
ncbi:hypothetical protein BVIR_1422 [Blastochloris viridis]|uniref:Uncharacterized protein n=1 Tax=Blastochloris viridis TaxID=1079 RepID=A0A0N7IUF4_BLAVI|nr:hypothetical protein BVIR_1422 [Blastochloris viridis]CUU41869.1 hypothetical protein BVIRIDIS_08670 [Blastochloris viridis]